MKHLRTATVAQMRKIASRRGRDVPKIVPADLRPHQVFRITTDHGVFAFEITSEKPKKGQPAVTRAWVRRIDGRTTVPIMSPSAPEYLLPESIAVGEGFEYVAYMTPKILGTRTMSAPTKIELLE